MYYGARYYDPVLSMFISADPTTPDAKNPMDYEKYLYVRGNPLRLVDPSGYGPNDQYIFAAGCNIGSSTCKGVDQVALDTFGGFMDVLRNMYVTGGWGWSMSGLTPTYTAFNDWANTHVHTVNSAEIKEGAARINEIIANEIPKDESINIHLFGTSSGGAAILEYLEGTRALGRFSDYTLDHRIASLVLIDSPLPWVGHNHPSGMVDSMEGMGNYLGAHTRIKTDQVSQDRGTNTALTVDAPKSWVDADPIDGVQEWNNPDYTYPPKDPTSGLSAPITGPERHTYVTSNTTPNITAFLNRVWR